MKGKTLMEVFSEAEKIPVKPIPVSIKTEKRVYFGIEVELHVLDNGQRVIEKESFEKIIALLGGKPPKEAST